MFTYLEEETNSERKREEAEAESFFFFSSKQASVPKQTSAPEYGKARVGLFQNIKQIRKMKHNDEDENVNAQFPTTTATVNKPPASLISKDSSSSTSGRFASFLDLLEDDVIVSGVAKAAARNESGSIILNSSSSADGEEGGSSNGFHAGKAASSSHDLFSNLKDDRKYDVTNVDSSHDGHEQQNRCKQDITSGCRPVEAPQDEIIMKNGANKTTSLQEQPNDQHHRERNRSPPSSQLQQQQQVEEETFCINEKHHVHNGEAAKEENMKQLQQISPSSSSDASGIFSCEANNRVKIRHNTDNLQQQHRHDVDIDINPSLSDESPILRPVVLSSPPTLLRFDHTSDPFAINHSRYTGSITNQKITMPNTDMMLKNNYIQGRSPELRLSSTNVSSCFKKQNGLSSSASLPSFRPLSSKDVSYNSYYHNGSGHHQHQQYFSTSLASRSMESSKNHTVGWAYKTAPKAQRTKDHVNGHSHEQHNRKMTSLEEFLQLQRKCSRSSSSVASSEGVIGGDDHHHQDEEDDASSYCNTSSSSSDHNDDDDDEGFSCSSSARSSSTSSSSSSLALTSVTHPTVNTRKKKHSNNNIKRGDGESIQTTNKATKADVPASTKSSVAAAIDERAFATTTEMSFRSCSTNTTAAAFCTSTTSMNAESFNTETSEVRPDENHLVLRSEDVYFFRRQSEQRIMLNHNNTTEAPRVNGETSTTSHQFASSFTAEPNNTGMDENDHDTDNNDEGFLSYLEEQQYYHEKELKKTANDFLNLFSPFASSYSPTATTISSAHHRRCLRDDAEENDNEGLALIRNARRKRLGKPYHSMDSLAGNHSTMTNHHQRYDNMSNVSFEPDMTTTTTSTDHSRSYNTLLLATHNSKGTSMHHLHRSLSFAEHRPEQQGQTTRLIDLKQIEFMSQQNLHSRNRQHFKNRSTHASTASAALERRRRSSTRRKHYSKNRSGNSDTDGTERRLSSIATPIEIEEEPPILVTASGEGEGTGTRRSKFSKTQQQQRPSSVWRSPAFHRRLIDDDCGILEDVLLGLSYFVILLWYFIIFVDWEQLWMEEVTYNHDMSTSTTVTSSQNLGGMLQKHSFFLFRTLRLMIYEFGMAFDIIYLLTVM